MPQKPENISKSIIQFFVKIPRKVNVKTRLALEIGNDSAMILYKNFVSDIIDVLMSGETPFRIYFFPPDSKDEIKKWLGNSIECQPQNGDNLGERMKNAFLQSFSEGFEKTIIIGSDLPDIKNSIIDEAFSSLESNDAVIGPAFDGGYYLIGLKSSITMPDIFSGIRWSTNSVFRETINILKSSRLKVHILQELRDIDTMEDLYAFYMRNKGIEPGISKTMDYITKHKEALFTEK